MSIQPRTPLPSRPGPPAPPRPSLLRDDFTVFCDGVRRVCGIDLSQYKRAQMERRVRTFVERQGSGDLAAYLQKISTDPAELEAFLDRVTINVSQLWRNPDQWTRLERTVLPELFAEKRGVKAWSAGSSYGAEAFTLAALCRHVAPAGARVQITGTDVDKRIVERARTGVFSADDTRDAPSALLKRFFEAGAGGSWTVRSELRPLVTFEVADLLRLPARPEAYDLILCRNTVIYFTDDVRDALHAKLVQSLRPAGYLMVGSTERVSDTSGLGLVPAFPFTYRKAG
jgi:chemotaxis protein methyltransferase CheR